MYRNITIDSDEYSEIKINNEICINDTEVNVKNE